MMGRAPVRDNRKVNLKEMRDTPPWDWPRDAKHTIRKALEQRHSSSPDRIIAAELAGDLIVMDDDVAKLLLSIVPDPQEPEDVRAKAAIAFGALLEETEMEGFDEFGEPRIDEDLFNRIQQTLRNVTSDESAPKEVRRRALEASVRAPQDWHKEAVRKAYDSGDAEWKLTAVFCMRYIHGFDSEVLHNLESPNKNIRLHAVQAAGSNGVAQAWPIIERLASSPATDKNLRLAAIEAAPSVNAEEARSLLSELLDDDDEEISDAASEALIYTDTSLDEEDDDEENDEDGPF